MATWRATPPQLRAVTSCRQRLHQLIRAVCEYFGLSESLFQDPKTRIVLPGLKDGILRKKGTGFYPYQVHDMFWAMTVFAQKSLQIVYIADGTGRAPRPLFTLALLQSVKAAAGEPDVKHPFRYC